MVVPEYDIYLAIAANPKGKEIEGALENLHKYEGTSTVSGTIGGNSIVGHCIIELSDP